MEPAEAFKLRARMLDRETIELSYAIAPGYYLYRDKFKFRTAPEEAKLGAVTFPSGERKLDPFFGEQEIYRGRTRIRLATIAPDNGRFVLFVTSQGCAEVGVCFPPETQSVMLRAPRQVSKARRATN